MWAVYAEFELVPKPSVHGPYKAQAGKVSLVVVRRVDKVRKTDDGVLLVTPKFVVANLYHHQVTQLVSQKQQVL